MPNIINRDSFILNDGETEKGTVEITLGGETRRVPGCYVKEYGWVIAYGVVGRYRTSTKNWPAMVRSQRGHDGKFFEVADFGRDDRSGRFNKLNCISFKPE